MSGGTTIQPISSAFDREVMALDLFHVCCSPADQRSTCRLPLWVARRRGFRTICSLARRHESWRTVIESRRLEGGDLGNAPPISAPIIPPEKPPRSTESGTTPRRQSPGWSSRPHIANPSVANPTTPMAPPMIAPLTHCVCFSESGAASEAVPTAAFASGVSHGVSRPGRRLIRPDRPG
jgi:hypothetical protein